MRISLLLSGPTPHQTVSGFGDSMSDAGHRRKKDMRGRPAERLNLSGADFVAGYE